jgi:hypothetical protein
LKDNALSWVHLLYPNQTGCLCKAGCDRASICSAISSRFITRRAC